MLSSLAMKCSTEMPKNCSALIKPAWRSTGPRRVSSEPSPLPLERGTHHHRHQLCLYVGLRHRGDPGREYGHRLLRGAQRIDGGGKVHSMRGASLSAQCSSLPPRLHGSNADRESPDRRSFVRHAAGVSVMRDGVSVLLLIAACTPPPPH